MFFVWFCHCRPVLNLAKRIDLRNAGFVHLWKCLTDVHWDATVLYQTCFFPPFHPQNITCLFVIYFENEIHLFWQMLVLGQWPKLSLIFWTATQDLWFILCCQTNKIVHLSHCGIIIFLEGIQRWTCSVWKPDTDMAVRQEVGWSVKRKCSSVILINPDAWNICWINVKDSGRHSCCKLQFTRLSSCDQQNFSATNEDSCEVTQQLLIIYLRIQSLLSILLGRVFIPGQRDLRPHWPSHGHFFEISRSEGLISAALCSFSSFYVVLIQIRKPAEIRRRTLRKRRHFLEWAPDSFPLLGPNPIPLLELYFRSFDNIEL